MKSFEVIWKNGNIDSYDWNNQNFFDQFVSDYKNQIVSINIVSTSR